MIGRERKERALVFEKRSGRRIRGCGQSFMGEEDCCGPAVTDSVAVNWRI